MKNFLLAAGLLASSVSAHMQMSEPFPIRSPLNKDSEGKKDYSYTNPLSTDGSDFPCKGYADDPFNATANYNPGGSYPLKLAGSATHKGGSCQISLSYDKGKTFQVIHSILGGCPIDKEYKFTVPSDAPSGEALLAWSWFNKVGNREMYMNCAQVNIGSEGDSQSREMVDNADNDDDLEANNTTAHATNAQGFDSLPPIFIANVNGPGKCKTVEGKDVNFPKPGPSVEGSVEGKGYKCDGDANFLASNSGSSTTSSSNSTESSSSHNSNAPDDANAPMSSSILDYQRNDGDEKKHPVAFGTIASEARFGPPTGAPRPQGQAAHGHGQGHHHGGGKPHQAWGPPGGITCSPNGKSFSLFTADGTPIDMGSVADGTICREGKITWA